MHLHLHSACIQGKQTADALLLNCSCGESDHTCLKECVMKSFDKSPQHCRVQTDCVLFSTNFQNSQEEKGGK